MPAWASRRPGRWTRSHKPRAQRCATAIHVDLLDVRFWHRQVDLLTSRSDRSPRTITKRRRPMVVVASCPSAINSYTFVRPKLVASQASSIVQLRRWEKGTAGSSCFGEDDVELHSAVFLTLTVPHKRSSTGKLESAKIDRGTSEVNAYIRGPPRTIAYGNARSNISGCQRRRMNFLEAVAE